MFLTRATTVLDQWTLFTLDPLKLGSKGPDSQH